MELCRSIWMSGLLGILLVAGCAFNSTVEYPFAPDTTPTPTPTVNPLCESGTLCTVYDHGLGDGGSAAEATFGWPRAWAISGNDAYLADALFNMIRHVDLSTGIITTVAGTGEYPPQVTTGGDPLQTALQYPTALGLFNGRPVWSEEFSGHFYGIDASGNVELLFGDGPGDAANEPAVTSQWQFAHDIGEGPSSLMIVADGFNHQVRAVNLTGNPQDIIGGTVDPGMVLTIAGTGNESLGGNGVPAYTSDMGEPHFAQYDSDSDTFFISEGTTQRVRSVNNSDGIISAVAGKGTTGYSGDGGLATAAELSHPTGTAVLGDFLLILDDGNKALRAVNLSSIAAEIAGIDVVPDGIETIAGRGNDNFYWFDDGGNALFQGFDTYDSVPRIVDGQILFIDSNNRCIRALDPATGDMTVVAGRTAAAEADVFFSPQALAFGGDGHLYVAQRGPTLRRIDLSNGDQIRFAGSGDTNFSGDGAQAIDAGFYGESVAVAADGSIYVGDRKNHVVRRIGTGGLIETIAGDPGTRVRAGDGGPATDATFAGPDGLTVDADGNLYVADSNTIRFINMGRTKLKIGTIEVAGGDIDRVAGLSSGDAGSGGDGNSSLSAGLDLRGGFTGLAVGNGSLYIADHYNNRIRAMDLTSGNIDTIAGTGDYGHSGDGADATFADVGHPTGLALDTNNEVLYLAQEGGHVVRQLDLQTGFIDGMAGSGQPGRFGDNCPPQDAQLAAPTGLALGPDGTLYIAEVGRIRQVAP